MTERTAPRTRRVIVVDNSHVARRVGDRIRQARVRANMTQAQVAKGRYTAAYISALERGLAKPSMAALTFLSERLGVSIPDLVAEDRPASGRLEADLKLASGNWQEALDQYDALLDAAGDDRSQRAEVLRGRAEALCRLDRGREAIRAAAESAEIFDELGAPRDAAWARYWLASGHYKEDNTVEARSLLHQLLDAERAGLEVAPDFRFRLLVSLGNVEGWDGEAERALTYMEEALPLVDQMSLRQRAVFLSGLALQYRYAGDLERSIRVGHESLALYRAVETELEKAGVHINMALNFSELGNDSRAKEHVDRAREIAERHDEPRLLSEIADAEARLALAAGNDALAGERAEEAIRTAESGGSYLAGAHALVTLGRVAHRRGDVPEAERRYAEAARVLREHRARTFLREVLGEWAKARADTGDATGANELYAEALSAGSRRR